MTANQSAVAKLLASFEDEREIENLPIEEIQADLRILGVDPTASIALAEALAAAPRSPVASLLAKIEESEASPAPKAARSDAVDTRRKGSATPAAAKVAPNQRTSPGLAVDGHWRVKSVANGAMGQRPRPAQPTAASRKSGFDLERGQYNPHVRRPQPGLKVAPRARPVRMAVAACVALLSLGGAWIYSREQPQTYQIAAPAASSGGRPAQPVAGDLPEPLTAPQLRDVRTTRMAPRARRSASRRWSWRRRSRPTSARAVPISAAARNGARPTNG